MSEDRYKEAGGLPGLAKRFEEGETLVSLGEQFGISRTSIRNDLIQHLELIGYKKVIVTKRRQLHLSKTYDIPRALSFLHKRLRSATGRLAEQLRGLVNVLEQAERNGVRLTARVTTGKTLQFFLSDGERIAIRVGVPLGNRIERLAGFYRFKITPHIETYKYVIFAVSDSSGGMIYIFKPSEIVHIQSLNLRFRPSRRAKFYSKYDYAQDRWGLLANS